MRSYIVVLLSAPGSGVLFLWRSERGKLVPFFSNKN